MLSIVLLHSSEALGSLVRPSPRSNRRVLWRNILAPASLELGVRGVDPGRVRVIHHHRHSFRRRRRLAHLSHNEHTGSERSAQHAQHDLDRRVRAATAGVHVAWWPWRLRHVRRERERRRSACPNALERALSMSSETPSKSIVQIQPYPWEATYLDIRVGGDRAGRWSRRLGRVCCR
jgi:hypothetical protein